VSVSINFITGHMQGSASEGLIASALRFTAWPPGQREIASLKGRHQRQIERAQAEYDLLYRSEQRLKKTLADTRAELHETQEMSALLGRGWGVGSGEIRAVVSDSSGDAAQQQRQHHSAPLKSGRGGWRGREGEREGG